MVVREFIKYLYGCSYRFGNPGKNQYIDIGGPARSKARAQPSTVAPDVSTSSTKDQAASCHYRFALWGHAKGTLDVLRTLRAAEGQLAARSA